MVARRRSWKAMFVVVLSVAQLWLVSGAQAVNGSGSLLVGHPGTISPRGATEAEFRMVKACQGIPSSQGVDGWVIDLNGVTGTMTVTGSSTAPFTLNLLFLNSACFPSGIWFTQGTSVSKAIPIGSRWAVVSAAYGASINLTYGTS